MKETKSVYKYAAEAGVPMGIYMIAISACFLLSLRFETLQMFIFPLVICFPFILGFMMRRLVKREPVYHKFSPLWLFGIYSVIFGTLICMLFSSVYLVFVDPGFISGYMTHAIEIIEALPTAGDYASTLDMMHKALDSHMLPNGTQFVTTMGWFTCFAGSILSLILALIISRGSSSGKRVMT